MSYFAKLENYIVQTVISAEQDFIDTLPDADTWFRTSYNTRGGIYYIPNTDTPDPDQSKAFRKNYAGVGFTYDPVLDAFIPPQPYPSWNLNPQSCLWFAPVPYPDDGGFHIWNEQTLSWE